VTDWHDLRDAYGPADAVPMLLARAKSDDRSVWDELWSRLCHQGSVQTASYAAVPSLAELAERREPAGYVEPLALATSILASVDGPETPDAIRSRYPESVASLNRQAKRNLALAATTTEFVYGLQALVATEATTVWARRLESITDGEAEFSCSQCGEQVLVDLVTTPARAKSFEDASVGVTRATAASLASLAGIEARLYQAAVEHGQADAAAGLLKLFGTCACPRCRSVASFRAALA
jgi:hypothetical protein